MSTKASHSPIAPALMVVLAILAAVAPFATDLYLSAFPAMASDLNTDAASIQLTLTAFLVGLAAGQLVFGPMSDRLGRRGPLIWGAAIFVVSSIGAVIAPTIQLLLVARLLQGLAGAAGMVIGRAVISDLARGEAAARAFSLMMIVGGVAPVIAPFAGSALVDFIGWRGVLGVLTGVAVVMLLGAIIVVRETLPASRRGRTADASSARALRSGPYVAATATFAFSFAVMMAYISASPFVYQHVMGMTPVGYGLMFGANAVGLILTSAIATRLLRTRSTRQILGFGVSALCLSTALLMAMIVLATPSAWLSAPILLAVASLGFIMGPATAIALGAASGAAGLASAVLGAAQFGLGGLVSPLVGLGGSTEVWPMGVVMLTLSLAAGASYLGLRSRHQTTEDAVSVRESAAPALAVD